jgi:ABC-type polar amino acid transport system ATPase subunit
MLNIKKLFLTKGKRPILTNVSLEIFAKKITILLGESGSGKTSLLRCIAQLEKSYQGEIAYRQLSLKSLDAKELCQLVGIVPQSFGLFPHLNALENCTQPLFAFSRKEANETALQMLASLGMEDFVAAYPHELSGGQQQRVAIARALLLRPRFLLLDEPTSALDPKNKNRLTKLLYQLRAKGIGILISSQDMVFAKEIQDRTLFLKEGKVLEQSKWMN